MKKLNLLFAFTLAFSLQPSAFAGTNAAVMFNTNTGALTVPTAAAFYNANPPPGGGTNVPALNGNNTFTGNDTFSGGLDISSASYTASLTFNFAGNGSQTVTANAGGIQFPGDIAAPGFSQNGNAVLDESMALNASQLTSGTVPAAVLPAALQALAGNNGGGLTNVHVPLSGGFLNVTLNPTTVFAPISCFFAGVASSTPSATNAAEFIPGICSYAALYVNIGSSTLGAGTNVIYQVYTNGAFEGTTITHTNGTLIAATNVAFTMTNGYIVIKAVANTTGAPISGYYSTWTLN
ncbi:MAG: hypothetical protein ACLQU4_11970 [Limisphaerales bacterium]